MTRVDTAASKASSDDATNFFCRLVNCGKRELTYSSELHLAEYRIGQI